MSSKQFHFYTYVSLRLRVQNRRKKWNFPLNFHTMRKLSDLYSGIFQTQSSGCASGVDHFRNFTKLKILNIWIVKYLLNCKRYLSYNFRIFQKISECWVLENLDVHLERTTSELEFKSEKSKIVTFVWNLMVKYWSDRIKFWIYTAFRAFQTSHQLLSLPVVYRSNRGMWVWVKTEDVLAPVPVLIFLLCTFLHAAQFWDRPNGC